jgi:autotransporter-associated beta strand protein
LQRLIHSQSSDEVLKTSKTYTHVKSKAILLSCIPLALSVVQATPLLTDNFNDTSTSPGTFNNNLATTQSGLLAPTTYKVSAPGANYTVQHGNNGSMLVVGNTGITGGTCSLNHDFAMESNYANKPLTVSFKVQDVTAAWGQFGIGNVQGDGVLGNDFAILFKSDGAWEAYANGTGLGTGATGSWADGALMTFVLSDTAGTGSAFNGNGSKVAVKIAGTTVATYTLGQLGVGYGYLTWGGYQFKNGGFSVMSVDDLSVDMDASFPTNEVFTWTGSTSSNWDESTANWSNPDSYTNWYSNSTNSVVFNSTGSAQSAVNLALSLPLIANRVTFDTAGYSLIGGPVSLGNIPTFATNADAAISAVLQGTGGIDKMGSATLSLTGSNSYTGITVIEEGILNAATFSDYGVSGSLGNRASDSSGNVGILLRSGTLQYTGATPQSTNRAIRVSTLGGTIDASGSVPSATLSFTATTSPDFFETAGDRTLTLTGSNTGDNIFGIAIGDANGATSVVKSGSGKWVLTGANTYTGSTTVNGGVLSLANQVLDNLSAVVINSGGVLNLNFTGNDIIGSLDIAGSGPLPAGIYNSSNPTYGSYFSGTGSLLVLNGSNGVWTSLANGIWDDSANWQSGNIASGFDQSATFNASTGVTVTLSGSKTIGSLVFDTSNYTLAGTSTLTLDASTTPSISVGSGHTATIEANLTGGLGLEKIGQGTLTLTGSKSYTGATIVSDGTLELSGATGGNAQIHGSVYVYSGTTLAITNGDGTGFGFYNDPVTSITADGGTIDAVSGNHLGFGTVMAVSLQNGATIKGSYWQWNGDSRVSFASSGDQTNTISTTIKFRSEGGVNHTFSVDDGASSTDLLVSGSLTSVSEKTNVVKIGTGAMVLSGDNTYIGDTSINDGAFNVTSSGSLSFYPTTNGTTNLVYGSDTASLSFLGTLNLDLTGADTTSGNVWTLFDLASFTGHTPILTPASVHSTTLGSFTKVSSGTWELPVTGGKWTFTEANGTLTYISSVSDYDTWKSANGVSGGPNDDDDHDGLTNQQEYAFGLNPTSGSSVSPIVVQLNKTTGGFSYTRRQQSLTKLTYTVWYSTDLVSWTLDNGATQGTPVLNGEVETVPVTISSSLLVNPKLFIRVSAD